MQSRADASERDHQSLRKGLGRISGTRREHRDTLARCRCDTRSFLRPQALDHDPCDGFHDSGVRLDDFVKRLPGNADQVAVADGNHGCGARLSRQ